MRGVLLLCICVSAWGWHLNFNDKESCDFSSDYPCDPDPPVRDVPIPTEVPTSKWGPQDRIGALNYQTPATIKKAASLIKQGKVFQLGVPVGENTPGFADRSFTNFVTQVRLAGDKGAVTYLDDRIEAHIGLGSQVDGLGHIGLDGVYYNKVTFPNVPIDSPAEAQDNHAGGDLNGQLAVADLPPIIARAVLLDIAALKGVEILGDSYRVTVDDLKAAANRQNVCINRGDVVILHTGWLTLVDDGFHERFTSTEPGIGVQEAVWLAEKGVIAVGADTWGLEFLPGAADRILFEPHLQLLAMHGVYILENMNIGPVLKAGYSQCYFTSSVPRFENSVQAFANPTCVV
eukprot:TRINITY_DN61598_c0_g1_i1.p1 TRINITY_DN61598_c0_g1~~TRINITY_DN61598_c0_g1_i1.p1  ORF type:complete len:346 (-),score=30.14 TRINITY_DN61598_c0_g1_i1:63-1100(-)